MAEILRLLRLSMTMISAGGEFGYRHPIDVGLDGVAVDGIAKDEGRDDPRGAPAGDELGGLPVAVRHGRAQPLASGTARTNTIMDLLRRRHAAKFRLWLVLREAVDLKVVPNRDPLRLKDDDIRPDVFPREVEIVIETEE